MFSFLAPIAAAVVGGSISSRGSKKAARMQADSATAQIEETRRQYDQNREDLAPYRERGTEALNLLSGLYRDPANTGRPIDLQGFYETGRNQFNDDENFLASRYRRSPGYQNQFSSAMETAQNTLAKRGLKGGGSELRGVTELAGNMAANDYGNYMSRGMNALSNNRTFSANVDNNRLNRLATMAGIGQSATNAGIASGNQLTGMTTGAMDNQGAYNASGVVGSANSWANTANQIANIGGYHFGKNGGGNALAAPAPASSGSGYFANNKQWW